MTVNKTKIKEIHLHKKSPLLFVRFMDRIILVLIAFILLISCTENSKQKLNITAVNFDLENPSQLPALFAEKRISTFMNERDLAISPEGNEIIYTLGNYNGSKRALVRLINTGANNWEGPEIMSFSGLYQDIEPFFSPDGSKLFFASTRPINGDSSRQDYNIWFVERSGSGYGEPRNVGDVINTSSNEFYPSVSKNGNLYFTATYDFGIGSEDIFVSEWTDGSFQAPQPLDSAINTSTYEFNAYVSPEEDLIIFSSFGRPDDLGGGDLYISEKDMEGNWSLSRNLGSSINSPSLDYCPFVDFQRNSFYFTSNRSGAKDLKIENVESLKKEYEMTFNGLDNIYQVNSSALNLSK